MMLTPIHALNWTQLGNDIDGEAREDESGSSVSLNADGTRVAIGAYQNDGNGDRSGHVRVYEYSAGSWTQLGSDIDGEAELDQSGRSVSLSADGNRVAIGANGNDGTAAGSGHVRVYEYSAGSWTQLGSDIDGEASSDGSGYSVSLSADGTKVAIGAYGADANGNETGHVRVYEYSSGSWTQLGSDIDGEAAYDRSGWSVSLSTDGTRVAIGAYNNDGNGTNAGHVRVYEYSSGSWTQLGSDIDGEAAYDYSGHSVSLSADGTKVAIGAYQNDGNGDRSGHVRVYEYSAGSWTQLGSDIDGEATQDFSGWSVSLSADGSRVAIGAYQNANTVTTAARYRGHARVYEYAAGSWTQLGSDIDGEAHLDQFGYSVSLSADGTKVAIGARFNDNQSDAYLLNSGHVRIYGFFKACGETSTLLTENKWWSISRPCGTTGNPTIAELFNGVGLGTYGDENNWVMYKLNGTNADGTENYTMISDTSEVMILGVGYWIITDQTGVIWNPGAIGESADPAGTSWNIETIGTVTPASLGLTVAMTDVKEFFVMSPVTDGGLNLVQDNQLALIGNPFNKSIIWSNVYFSNNGTINTYAPIDSMTSGVKPIAFVSDPNSVSGQPYKAISSAPGFTHTIESRQAFWILMTGTSAEHSAKKIALPYK